MSSAPPTSSASHTLPFHADRARLFNELHTRPFPVLAQNARISQLAVLHEGADAATEYRHLRSLCEQLALQAPPQDSACHHLDFGNVELRWERHTEFSTYTMIRQCDDSVPPFTATALSLLPPDWLAALPGKIISGLHVEIQAASSNEAMTADSIRTYFEEQRMISSWVIDRRARLWTAWRLHRDGLGRILVLNGDLNPCQLGRLVRRLLELETYRMMVLLAFPMARGIAPDLGGMDTKLASINVEINAIRGLDDERRLLGELSTLSARIEHLRSETNFRFSAARAYYELVQDRLTGLREQEESGLQTLGEFLPRRLTPAFRTTEAVSAQLDGLASRIERASELLRTRIDLTLEAQNQDLLQSMNHRSQIQLQLQQAVEGLSVVAITYYLVGLVKSLAESLHELGWVAQPALVAGIAMPVCLALVWLGVRQLRHNLTK